MEKSNSENQNMRKVVYRLVVISRSERGSWTGQGSGGYLILQTPNVSILSIKPNCLIRLNLLTTLSHIN